MYLQNDDLWTVSFTNRKTSVLREIKRLEEIDKSKLRMPSGIVNLIVSFICKRFTPLLSRILAGEPYFRIVRYILLLHVYLLCSFDITDHYSDPM